MKRLLIFTLILLTFKLGIAQQFDKGYQKVVLDFIDCIKNEDKYKLSTQISFPLKRSSPIPPINNSAQFLDRYKEIFDDGFVTEIINSNPDTDWGPVGSKGIMLFNGDLWLDSEGKLIGVNHQSPIEKRIQDKLLNNIKNNLHHSLAEFDNSVLTMETSKFKIRIDDLGNGNFRYASWSSNQGNRF